MKNQPLISIVLPVYNGAEFLNESIDSILAQTYLNWELIIIDDGSSDDSWNIIQEYKSHPKLTCIKQENQGLSKTLNNACKLARGEFIARQDHDDVSLPTRIEKQVQFFIQNPKTVLLGTWAKIIEYKYLSRRTIEHPIKNNELQSFLLLENPFVHPSVMFPRSSFISAQGYTLDSKLQPPEDFELWTRLAPLGDFSNIGEHLVLYRELKTSMSRKIEFSKSMFEISKNYLIKVGLDEGQAQKLSSFYHLNERNSLYDLFTSILIYSRAVKKVKDLKKIRLNRVNIKLLIEILKKFIKRKL